MSTIQQKWAELLQKCTSLGQTFESLGSSSGYYLQCDGVGGISIVELNCIERFFRWAFAALGAYSSTHLATIAKRLSDSQDVPQALCAKIVACWQKIYPQQACPLRMFTNDAQSSSSAERNSAAPREQSQPSAVDASAANATSQSNAEQAAPQPLPLEDRPSPPAVPDAVPNSEPQPLELSDDDPDAVEPDPGSGKRVSDSGAEDLESSENDEPPLPELGEAPHAGAEAVGPNLPGLIPDETFYLRHSSCNVIWIGLRSVDTNYPVVDENHPHVKQEGTGYYQLRDLEKNPVYDGPIQAEDEYKQQVHLKDGWDNAPLSVQVFEICNHIETYMRQQKKQIVTSSLLKGPEVFAGVVNAFIDRGYKVKEELEFTLEKVRIGSRLRIEWPAALGSFYPE